MLIDGLEWGKIQFDYLYKDHIGLAINQSNEKSSLSIWIKINI